MFDIGLSLTYYIDTTRMRAALRHLCQKGVEALKPQKVASKRVAENGYQRQTEVWRRPVVSKRVGNVLRKTALKEGTYGSFDTTTGVGWDPEWDLVLKSNQFASQRNGNIRPKKGTKRERTREARAQAIEQELATQPEKMEEYYTNKEQLRVQETSFEAHYKRLLRTGGSRP